jgi:hypothetical protein
MFIITSERGVDGWLLLFCMDLMYLIPLTALLNLITLIAPLNLVTLIARLNLLACILNYSIYPNLLVVQIIDKVLVVGLAIISAYAGILLLAYHKNAINIAKKFLLLLLIYEFIRPFLVLFSGLPSQVTLFSIREGLKQYFVQALIIFIWYAYLIKSKRVGATYEPGQTFINPTTLVSEEYNTCP